MAKAKNWAVTDLTQDDACYAVIDGDRYDITQMVATYAKNEIPQATCMLALGSRTRPGSDLFTVGDEALIHSEAETLRMMKRAEIWLHLRGVRNTFEEEWPDEPQLIFEGYYSGFSMRSHAGQMHVVVKMKHWLTALDSGSALSSFSHPSNPADLTFPALFNVKTPLVQGAGTGVDLPLFLPNHIGYSFIGSQVDRDLWGGIKDFLCHLAKQDQWDPLGGDGCLKDAISNSQNQQEVLRALQKIEGVVSDEECSRPYDSFNGGRELPLATNGIFQINEGIAESLRSIYSATFANTTLWGLIVGHFCRMYGMAVVPQIDKAIVVADIPGYRFPFDARFTANDYEGIDDSPDVGRPLRGVALVTGAESNAGAAYNGSDTAQRVTNRYIGGCFVAPIPSEAIGLIDTVETPPWLHYAANAGLDARKSTLRASNQPSASATSPEAGDSADPPNSSYGDVQAWFQKYAQMVFAAKTLQNRRGLIHGPLRLDVGPGSHIRIEGSPRRFYQHEDALTVDRYASVQRVTISINAQSGQASTAFQLAHVRTAGENSRDRTSIDRHPLFGTNVVRGVALSSDFRV